MPREGLTFEKKSLRLISENSGWDKLAIPCVAFANAIGGVVDLGVEDNDNAPPLGQKITDKLLEKVRGKIRDKTKQVQFQAERRETDGGQLHSNCRRTFEQNRVHFRRALFSAS